MKHFIKYIFITAVLSICVETAYSEESADNSYEYRMSINFILESNGGRDYIKVNLERAILKNERFGHIEIEEFKQILRKIVAKMQSEVPVRLTMPEPELEIHSLTPHGFFINNSLLVHFTSAVLICDEPYTVVSGYSRSAFIDATPFLKFCKSSGIKLVGISIEFTSTGSSWESQRIEIKADSLVTEENSSRRGFIFYYDENTDNFHAAITWSPSERHYSDSDFILLSAYIAAFYIIGFGGLWIFAGIIARLHKSGEIVRANKLAKYHKYSHWVIIILFNVFIIYLRVFDYSGDIVGREGPVFIIAGIGVYLLLSIGFLILAALATHRISRESEKSEISYFKITGLSLIGIAYYIGINLIWVGVVIGVIQFAELIKMPHWLFLPVIIMLFALYLLFLFSIGRITQTMGVKKLPLEDADANARLTALAGKASVKVKSIKALDTGGETANAMVTGLFGKHMFITDHLLANTTHDELETILAHEIGHIKNRDLWISFGFSFLWLLFYLGVRELIEILFGKNAFADSPALGYVTQITLMGLYFVILFGFISRWREYQADKYVAKIASNPAAYISALNKLVKLNQDSEEETELDEKLSTHPSIVKRVNRFKIIINFTDTTPETEKPTNENT